MAKEFFDISPPKKILVKPEPERKIVEKKPSFSKKIAFSLILLLIIFGTFLFFALGKAEIEIIPKTELIDLEKKVLLDSEFKEPLLVRLKENTIPAEIIEDESTISREFPATGEDVAEKRAEGIVRVYNEYSTTSRTFVVNTRFLSTDGKLFRALEKITIPSQKYEEGKLKPGFVDIKVRAAEAGQEYNIGPTTFSIPGLLGTDMYTTFYAKSFSQMKGGFKGKASQVKKEDLERAEKLLEEEVFEESLAALEKKCDENSFILAQDCLLKEVLEQGCKAEVGEKIDSFTCEIKVKLKALVFREKDLEEFVENAILSQVQEKEIKPGSLELNYFLESKDLEKGQANLNLIALAEIYSPLEETLLKKGIAAKPKKTAKILLESHPEIKQAEIKLWPFWLKEIPKNLEKIRIRTVLD